MKSQKLSFSYVGWVLIAMLFTWLIHEFTHWFTAYALGYESRMTLNTVSLVKGSYTSEFHNHLVSATGPIITIIQAILVFVLMKKGRLDFRAWPFLFLPFYTRVLAGVMNYINLNDEGRISHALGIGDYTLSILVSAGLGYLMVKTAQREKYGSRFHWVTVLLCMFFSSVLILSDQFFGGIVLLQG